MIYIYTDTYTSIYSTLDRLRLIPSALEMRDGEEEGGGASSLNLLSYLIFLENSMLLLGIDWILLDFINFVWNIEGFLSFFHRKVKTTNVKSILLKPKAVICL